MRVGRYGKAEQEYDNVVKIVQWTERWAVGDEAPAFIRRGRAREKLGRLAEAAEDYGEALKAHPGNIEARERLEAVKKKMQESGKP